MLKTFTITPSDLRCIVVRSLRKVTRKTTYKGGVSTGQSITYGGWSTSTYNYDYTPIKLGYDYYPGAWSSPSMVGDVDNGYTLETKYEQITYYRIVATCDFSPYVDYDLSAMTVTLTPSSSVSSATIYVALKSNSTVTSSEYGTSVAETISGASAQTFDVTSLGIPSYGLVVYSSDYNLSPTEMTSIIIQITADVNGVGYVNVNGLCKEATTYVNVSGTWKEAVSYVNVGGTWKEGI